MLKGDVHIRYADAFMACLKDGFMQWSLKTVSKDTLCIGTHDLFIFLPSLLVCGPLLHQIQRPFIQNLLSR